MRLNLGEGIVHGQVVLVRRRVLAGGRTSIDHGWTGRLENVLLISGHGAVVNGQGAGKRHQGVVNLSIGRGVNLAAFGTAEGFVDRVNGVLAVIATRSGAVTGVLAVGIVQGPLGEVETMAGRGLGSVVAARMPGMVREREGVGSHLAITVAVASMVYRRISLERRVSGWPRPRWRIELGYIAGRLRPGIGSALGVLGRL
jgi:hypothetical protein